MEANSLWNFHSDPTNFAALSKDLSVDIAIIGGGITGISAAQTLSQDGHNVAVLEARSIGGGTTAHSTGNLYATTDKNLEKLVHKHGFDAVKNLINARSETIDIIENNIKELKIDCDFQRVPLYFYATSKDDFDKVDDEYEAAHNLGLNTEKVELSYPYQTKKAITIHNQAQFNAKLYVQGLAKAIASSTCQIFENSPVHSIESDEMGHKLKMKNGSTVVAKTLVHATHIPKGVKVIQSFLGPYREYGIACRIDDVKFKGIFWGYHGEDNFISSRTYTHDENSYLIVVGQPHKVGQKDDNQACIEKLCTFAKQSFNIKEIPFKWGGQHYRPADFLPYIGKEKKHSNVYIATGFSTDGLVYGTLSAKVIKDVLRNKETPITKMFKPSRNDYLKAMPNFIKENVNVALQYLRDFPILKGSLLFNDIENGSGAVVEHKGHKLAAYRDEAGSLSVCSAVCTHMKCIVNWNSAEKSWDCPCHGSRFDPKGLLLEGPALHDLHKITLAEDTATQ